MQLGILEWAIVLISCGGSGLLAILALDFVLYQRGKPKVN